MRRCIHQAEWKAPIVIECAGKRRQFLTAVCPLHRRCLPRWRPSTSDRAKWVERPESDLYRICSECGDYELR